MRAPTLSSASPLARLVLFFAVLLLAMALSVAPAMAKGLVVASAADGLGANDAIALRADGPAPLAGYLSDDALRVNADVVLVPSGGAEADPVVGSFTAGGLTYALVDKGTVALVAAAPQTLAGGLVDGSGQLAALALPESVGHDGVSYSLTAIGPRAFAGCDAGAVVLPVSVEAVDQAAFEGSSAASIEVAEDSPSFSSYDGMLFDADLIRLLLVPEGKQGAARIPSTAEVVDPSCFSHSAGVSSIDVEAGSAAFSSRNGLLYDASGETLLRVPAGAAGIEIADGCTTVAAGSFEGCEGLGRIGAPASVSVVSPAAFGRDAGAADLSGVAVVLIGEGDEAPWRALGIGLFVSTSAGTDGIGGSIEGLSEIESVGTGGAFRNYSRCIVLGNGGTVYYNGQNSDDGHSFPNFYNMYFNGPRFNPESTDSWRGEVRRPGYVFTHWTSNGRSFTSGSVGKWSSDSGTVYVSAQWAKNPTLTYDPNGGTFPDGGTAPISKNGAYSSSGKLQDVLYPEDPSREGHRFAGWRTARDGGAQVGPDTALPTGDATYYASWVAAGPRVSFHADAASCDEGKVWRTIWRSYGDAVTCQGYVPPYQGPFYASYVALSSGRVEALGVTSSEAPPRACTYYVGTSGTAGAEEAPSGVQSAWLVSRAADGSRSGRWIDAAQASLVGASSADVYLNGYGASAIAWDATGGVAERERDEGIMPYQEVTAPSATQACYVLVGWAAEPDGEVIAEAGDRISAAPGATYYAVWAGAPYEVALDANGGDVSPTSVEGIHGGDLDLPEPSRYGYAFMGWDTEPNGTGTRLHAGVNPTPDLDSAGGPEVTVYAQWALIVDVDLPVQAASGVAFELGVPDGMVRVAGTEAEVEAQGWLRNRMPVEVALDSIAARAPEEPPASGAAASFWADYAPFADLTIRAFGAGMDDVLALSPGSSVTGSAIPASLAIPAAASADALGEREVRYGLRLDRLFADPMQGGAGVDIVDLLPDGSDGSFALPARLMEVVFTVDVAKYA